MVDRRKEFSERNEVAAEIGDAAQRSSGKKRTLDLCFMALIGAIAISALVAALNYRHVSARAPLSVLLPLLILIGVQFRRTVKSDKTASVGAELGGAMRGENQTFNAVAGLIGSMALLLALIFIAGHYVGIAVFMFFLLRAVSRKSYALSSAVSAGVTSVVYLLFEHGFNVEMYRGIIFRLLSGYSGG